MNRYMRVQVKKIEVDKWYEGINTKRDPGKPFIFEWISRNAAWFRTAWNDSLCRQCQNWQDCGHELRDECPLFFQSTDGKDTDNNLK